MKLKAQFLICKEPGSKKTPQFTMHPAIYEVCQQCGASLGHAYPSGRHIVIKKVLTVTGSVHRFLAQNNWPEIIYEQGTEEGRYKPGIG